MKQAILVIDVQQGLSAGRHAMFDANQEIERINGVTQRARAAGVPVILIQHESADGLLVHGSPGWQLAQGLRAEPSDIRLRKTATDAFHKTELLALLQGLEIGHLVVCGFQSDFCVDTTTRSALRLGYPLTLIADGHSTLDNGVLTAAQITAHHNVTLSNIESFGPRATLVKAQDVRFPAS